AANYAARRASTNPRRRARGRGAREGPAQRPRPCLRVQRGPKAVDVIADRRINEVLAVRTVLGRHLRSAAGCAGAEGRACSAQRCLKEGLRGDRAPCRDLLPQSGKGLLELLSARRHHVRRRVEIEAWYSFRM